MRLRSFSLAKVLPAEIIGLIITQSADSVSALYNWSLVSVACLNVAGPLLQDTVKITSDDTLLSLLHRFLVLTPLDDNTSPGRQAVTILLPRLVRGLSLERTWSISFRHRPSGRAVAALMDVCERRQPTRPRLRLEHRWPDQSGLAEDAHNAYVTPVLMRLLRPSEVFDMRLKLPGHSRPPRSAILHHWPLQMYQAYFAQSRAIPSQAVVDPETFLESDDATALGVMLNLYDVVLSISNGRAQVLGLCKAAAKRCVDIREEKGREHYGWNLTTDAIALVEELEEWDKGMLVRMKQEEVGEQGDLWDGADSDRTNLEEWLSLVDDGMTGLSQKLTGLMRKIKAADDDWDRRPKDAPHTDILDHPGSINLLATHIRRKHAA